MSGDLADVSAAQEQPRLDRWIRWWPVAIVAWFVAWPAVGAWRIVNLATHTGAGVGPIQFSILLGLVVVRIVAGTGPVPNARMRLAKAESPGSYVVWARFAEMTLGQLDELIGADGGTRRILVKQAAYILRVAPGRLEILGGAFLGASPRPVVRASLALPGTVHVHVAPRSVLDLRFVETLELDVTRAGKSYPVNIRLLNNGSLGGRSVMTEEGVEHEVVKLRTVLGRDAT